MTNETLMEIALEELTKPIPKYKEPDNSSIRLGIDDYGWDYEARRVHGDPYFSFCNPDVIRGVVAMKKGSKNQPLVNSSYSPRHRVISRLLFDYDADSLGLSNEQFDNIKIDSIEPRYWKYIERVVFTWPWDSQKVGYDFKISYDDQQRIKQCFGFAIKTMVTNYCPVLGSTIDFTPCNLRLSMKK